jgi:hypothetical protein
MMRSWSRATTSPLDPPVQGHVVNLDATLGEELFQAR